MIKKIEENLGMHLVLAVLAAGVGVFLWQAVAGGSRGAAQAVAVAVPQFSPLALGSWRNSDRFTRRERTVLDYAEAMTRTGAGVTDLYFEALRREFSDEAIVELTGLVTFQNLSSKFNAALAVPPQGFCERPMSPAAGGVQESAACGVGTRDGERAVSLLGKDTDYGTR